MRVTTVRPSKWNFDTIGRVAKIMFALAQQAVRNTGSIAGDEMEREENWMIEDYTVPDAAPAPSLTSGAEAVLNQLVAPDRQPDK